MAISLGLNWWEATLISLMNLTSAGQFAGLSIMAAGGSLVEMALSQVIINLRYSLMSITLSQRVDDSISGIWRYIIPFSNTDEIFAVSVSKDRPVNRWYWLGLSLLPIIGWSSGTLFGALLGA
ncbi:MAG: AzlC family ABC transporter permease, partial [Firmicutes bacterium]|nr:AzlC family ABC transporter permease [Bacillota bacterium]